MTNGESICNSTRKAFTIGGKETYVPLEKRVEYRLRVAIRLRGGLYYKFVSPGNSGVPDRIVILRGKVWFVELKTDSGKVSPIQAIVHKQMADAGADVRVLFGLNDVDRFTAEIDKLFGITPEWLEERRQHGV